MEDIIVTLLDGTKVPKSQVPVGEIYINEKGQKVRKVSVNDITVTLLDGTKVPKSQVPVGTIYINEKGQKVRKVSVNDITVTLLDGTKIPKSQVPVGTIYINEKGQKVKKVLKTVPAQAQGTEGKNILNGLSSTLINGSNQLIKVSKTAIKKIGETSKKATASASAFMEKMVSKLLAQMNIGETIQSLEDYQKSSGQDVSDLINLLKKLQTVK